MYNYFDAESSQGTPDTVSHSNYKRNIRRCMLQNQGGILYGLDTGAPYPFLFSLMYKCQLIFRYRVRTKRIMESLWFGLRLFLNKCWGQLLYPIGANKQNNMNQILLHLEVLRDSFCFHEPHTFYSTFPWNKKKSYLHLHIMLYRVGCLVFCQVMSCVYMYDCIHIYRFYYQKYCWKFFYISDNFRKRIKNNIKVKKKSNPQTGFEPAM
jgi:hypothetical protein